MTLYTYVVGRLSVSFDEQTLEWEARSPTLQDQIKKISTTQQAAFSVIEVKRKPQNTSHN